MASGSLMIVAIILAAVLAAAGFYLYQVSRGGDSTGLFAPRAPRRLAFIERAYLDGGRKLLLVRRDDVEHLILVGGPIDLVVETGIKPESLIDGAAEADDFRDVRRSHETAAVWQRPDISLPAGNSPAPAGPRLPDASDVKEKAEEDMLELTPLEEAKAAQ